MAVIVLASAKGSPGVTTTALGLALTWPRPVVLVEADVAGGSSILAGYLQGQVRPDHSLVDLAMAERRGRLAETLWATTLEIGGQARLVPAISSPAQAGTMHSLWEPLADVLRGLETSGVDAIVDAGRLGAAGGPTPLLRSADSVLLTTRTDLPAVAATHARAAALRTDLTAAGAEDVLALLLVGEGHQYPAREVASFVQTPVAAVIAWDPVNAEVLYRGAPAGRKYESSSLTRSLTAAQGKITQLMSIRRSRLAPGNLVKGRNDG